MIRSTRKRQNGSRNPNLICTEPNRSSQAGTGEDGPDHNVDMALPDLSSAMDGGGTSPPTATPPDKSQVEASILIYGALVAISLALYSILRKRCARVMTPALAQGDLPRAQELTPLASTAADFTSHRFPQNQKNQQRVGGDGNVRPGTILLGGVDHGLDVENGRLASHNREDADDEEKTSLLSSGMTPSSWRNPSTWGTSWRNTVLGRQSDRDQARKRRDHHRDRSTCSKACSKCESVSSLDLSWSWKALALRERDLVRIAGLDAYIFLRVVRFCWAVMTGYAIVSLLFLIPVYLGQPMPARCVSVCQSHELAHKKFDTDPDDPWDAASCICGDIDRASMANIASRSTALWTPVLVIYIFTMSTLWAANVEYRAMVRIKRRYWGAAPPEAYSVLVEHLPQNLRDRSGRLLYDYFDKVFPNRVFSVSMVDTGTPLFRHLNKVGASRNTVLWKLERAIVEFYKAQAETRTKHWYETRIPWLSNKCCSEKGKWAILDKRREKVEFLRAELDELNQEFLTTRRRYDRLCHGSESMPNSSETFESFKSFGTVTSSIDDSFAVLERSAASPPPARTASKEAHSGAIASEENNNALHQTTGEEQEDEEVGDNGPRVPPSRDDQYFSGAFVTFHTLKASTVASQTQIDSQSDMRVIPAPEPLDVAWGNIGMSLHERAVRRAVTKTAFYLLVLFWGVLTSVVGASTSTPALARQFPAVERLLEDNPNLESYLDMLAPLVLVSLVGVVNPLMSVLARFEGRVSETAADKRAMERYFVFLVVQVFLFYSIAGTVFKTLVEIFQQPSKIAQTLGASLPRNAAFYLQFIFVKLFWMLCFELLRVTDFILALLRRVVAGFPKTERERISLFCGCFELSYPSPISIPSSLAQILLVYFISIVYAVVQPLIVLVAFAFFMLANICYTTIITSTSKQMYDSGGRFWWNSAYRCIVAGLITSQLTLIGVMFIKGAIGMALPIWLLVFATLFVGYKIENRYSTLVSTLPMQLAAELDEVAPASSVEVRPAMWQYGSKTFPGPEGPEVFHNVLRPSSTRYEPTGAPAKHVYCFDHPVLQEQIIAKSFGLRRAFSSRYGTVSSSHS